MSNIGAEVFSPSVPGDGRGRLKNGAREGWPGWPYVLIGLAVVLRLIHIWNSHSNPTFLAPSVDPLWYDEMAMRILEGNWGPFPLFRAPAYPALLAGVYAVFGHDLLAARILNVALQGVTVWAVWWVGRAYFSPAIGVLAAALFALNGMAIYFAGEIVSPSLEMLASVLCAWTTFRLLRDTSLAAIIVCGLSYGFAAIVRPNFLFLFPVALIIVWSCLSSPRSRGEQKGGESSREKRDETSLWTSYRHRLLSCAIWSVAAFIPILPVTAANIFKGGEIVLVATQGGVNFWIGNNPESTGGLAILPGHWNNWEMEDANMDAERDLSRKLTPNEISNYYYHKGWTFIREHPLLASRLMIRKVALFFNHFEISNNKHIRYFARLSPWLPPLIWLNFGFLIPLATLGMWIRWRDPVTRITLALFLTYAVTVILFFVAARFRMPTVPWLSWFAAAGIVWLIRSVRSRVALRQLAPALLLIPVSLLAFVNVWQLRDAPVGWARLMEGNAYMRLNQPDSARAGFLDAIREGVDPRTASLNLGVMAFRDQHYTEAQQWYERALAYDSVYWKTWNNLGTVREALGDTAQAIVAYRRALSINPLADDAQVNLAGAYFREGVRALKLNHDSTAAAYLDSAVTLHDDPAAYYNLALARLRLGQIEQARVALDQATALDPTLEGAPLLREHLRQATAAPPARLELP